jgi:hypothetical protein
MSGRTKIRGHLAPAIIASRANVGVFCQGPTLNEFLALPQNLGSSRDTIGRFRVNQGAGISAVNDMFWPQPWDHAAAIKGCQEMFGVTPRPLWATVQLATCTHLKTPPRPTDGTTLRSASLSHA